MTYAYSAIRRHLRLSPDAGGAGGGGGQGDPPPGGNPGDGDGTGGDGDGGDDDPGDDDDDLEGADATKLKGALAKARQDRKEARRLARQLQQEKEQRDKADRDAQTEEARKKGEFEKVANDATARADKAEADLQAERDARRRDRTETAAQLHAASLNFHKPEDVTRYLDFAKVEYGDDGKPKNVKKLVDEIAKENAFLVKGDRAPGLPLPGQGNRDGGQTNAAQSYIASRYTPRAKD
jgi:hypothetical protein